jgi:transposase
MKRIEIKGYTEEQLDELIKSNSDYVVGIRLLAIKQFQKGKSSRDLEEFYGKSHMQLCTWARKFNEKGIEGLKNEHRSGRQPRMSKIQLLEMKEIILTKSPEEYGFNSGTWTCIMLVDLIKDHFGVEYTKSNVYNILTKKLGLSYQKGRGFFPEESVEQQEEFKKVIKKNARAK